MSEYTAREGTTALGIIGTALGGLATIGNGMGLLGIGANNTNTDDRPVTRYDLKQAQAIMERDTQIALLKAEQDSENKMTNVYERVMQRVNADAKAQADINTAQAVYNATNGSTVAVISNQVAQLMSLCQLKVNASNVCPAPMPQYNSWTAPTTA